MKKILLLLSAGLLGGQHIYAQAVKTVSGLRFYEHHSSTMNGGADFGSSANGAQSGYDFVKRTYFNSFDPKVSGGEYKKGEEANIDMVEHNGIFGNGGNFGFTSGVSTIWGGPIKGNSTTLWMSAPSTFNYGALADAKTIAAAYDAKKAKKSVEAVAEGGIYLAQIRGSKLYVAMRCFNVRNISSPSGKADVYFDFEYKYGEVSATSVAELGNHSSLSVYPNPATGSVVISNTLSAVLQAKIVSLYGQEVTAFTLEANSSRTVDMSALSAGLYFVSCTSADGATETYKLVKQ